MKYKIAGKKLVTVDGIQVNFTVIKKPNFLAGGGVALVKDEEVAKEFVELAALTARVKELEEAKDRLEKAAFQAVAHVAAANYPEREREAYNMLYTALRGEA